MNAQQWTRRLISCLNRPRNLAWTNTWHATLNTVIGHTEQAQPRRETAPFLAALIEGDTQWSGLSYGYWCTDVHQVFVRKMLPQRACKFVSLAAIRVELVTTARENCSPQGRQKSPPSLCYIPPMAASSC